MDTDSDEEEGRSSWISYKALKKAADVRSSFVKEVNSPGAWPGIGSERRANQVTNVSLSFLNVHRKYRDSRPSSEASAAELDQVLRETEKLQRLMRSQEEHYKAKAAVMMGYLQEAGKRKKEGDVRASLGSISARRIQPDRSAWLSHLTCQAEIETLKQTISQQEQIIEGLQNTVDTLHEKLAQQRKATQVKVRRKSNLSALQ
jgi:predicted RNase H-like nuclease (RuvC/YqgF family)